MSSLGGNLETLAVVAIWIGILLLTGRFAVAEKIGKRRAVSIAAGGSLAYIFVDLLPEINAAASLFRSSLKIALPYEGNFGVSMAMLLGFLCFYGLAEMAPTRKGSLKNARKKAFWAHTLGYGCYISIIGYLLVHSLTEVNESLPLYALSMSLHFILVGFGLHDLHEVEYDKVGRFVLAGFCLLGWLTGLLAPLPKPLVILLFGFVSGGVIAITGIVELPKNEEGRFIPFVAGAVSYALFLIVSR